MIKTLKPSLSLIALSLLAANTVLADWQDQLAQAKPGTTIQIPAGKHTVDSLKVPAGVTLQGAGHFATELIATGNEVGLVVNEVNDVTLRDLVLSGATKTNLEISRSSGVTLSGVLSRNALTGVMVADSTDVRMENSLVMDNRIGVSTNGLSDSALVNNTLDSNSSLGFSLVESKDVAVFNNIVSGSATGVYLSGSLDGLEIDHNAYFVNFIGNTPLGEYDGKLIEQWRDTSGGMDRSSISADMNLSREPGQIGKPLIPKNWAPGFAVPAGFGATEFAGHKAPTTDIRGNQWALDQDIGARSAGLPAPEREANGSFTVTENNGLKSAGIYDSQGRLVTYLFQNQPLTAGEYDYWIPVRNIFGQPIPSGDYEFKMVESDIHPEYISLLAKVPGDPDYNDQKGLHDQIPLFDDQGRPYLIKGWSENHTPIRAYDRDLETLRWFQKGNDTPTGVAIVGDSLFWMTSTENATAREINTDLEPVILRRVSTVTGELLDVIAEKQQGQGSNAKIIPAQRVVQFPDLMMKGPQRLRGLAGGGEQLFLPASQLGRIYYTDIEEPTFDQYWKFDSPWAVSYDEKTDLLWFISGGHYMQRDRVNNRMVPVESFEVGEVHNWVPREDAKVVAISPETGKIVTSIDNIPLPWHLSASNGRLAVISGEGKVLVFDASNPKAITQTRSLGQGTVPYGPIRDDVFTFNLAADSGYVTFSPTVAIDPEGRLLVIDRKRTMLFDQNNKLITMDFGQWGQHNVMAKFAGDDDIRIFGSGRHEDSIKVDSQNRTWQPDMFWSLPGLPYNSRHLLGFFSKDGRNFGVSWLRDHDRWRTGTAIQGYAIMEYMPDGEVIPLVVYWQIIGPDGRGVVRITDSNGDGHIDVHGGDLQEPLLSADGKPAFLAFGRYGAEVRDNGDLVVPRNLGNKWLANTFPFEGFDDQGIPIHDIANPERIPGTVQGGPAAVSSPYDWETKEALHRRNVQTALTSDGGLMTSATLKSGGGTGLQNGHGTDILGYGPDGELRWIGLFAHQPGIGGVQSLPSLGLGFGMYGECVYNLFDDKTGLGLGSLAMTPESRWRGMWSDHAQQQYPWIGNDGKVYYYVSDYVVNGHHWFEIMGTETIKRSSQPVTISEKQAEQMATIAAVPPGLPAQLTPPRTIITRLEKPLPINGDPGKWRQAGVPVSILITPETARGDITGPEDSSAVMRVAYEGDNLYFQAIQFDDVVTFHQPVSKMYLMDGVEIAINSFMKGLKYNLSVVDGEPTVKRDKFWHEDTTIVYENKVVPRSIITYENAEDFPERKVIEEIYGADLSQSKVTVYEMKLPLNDKAAFAPPLQNSKIIEKVAPGEEFYFGVFMNDNDTPGEDAQDFMSYPATYGTFQDMNKSSTAVFE